MKRLYFVRHGESTINTRGVWDAQGDGPLTELGEKQALKAGKDAKNRNLKIDVIVSSPTFRARQTAEIIADQIGYPSEKIISSELFIERVYGDLNGTSRQDFFDNNDYSVIDTIPGAETVNVLHDRAIKALSFLESLPYDNIMVVSHSAFGRALRRVITKAPPTDEYVRRTSLPHAEILTWIDAD